MSITQQYLVAALMLMFWREPYRQRLIPWGSALKDKWLLPYFLQKDFHAILDDLKKAGFPFAEYHFAPFYEFRFPLYGRYKSGKIEIELRMALEPWNVLGEETLSGNVSRAVDSSVERLQILVKNFDPNRYTIACNGYAVPLWYAAADDAYVAGVVFKAWSPPFTLHPTIPVHAPLQFAIYDKINQKYVGGCSYHVAHPGGRSYETFPVNANEAESRRLSRFHEQAEYPKNPPEILSSGVGSQPDATGGSVDLGTSMCHTLDLRLS